MNLNPETVNAYKTIMLDPGKYGFKFKGIKEVFIKSKKCTANHILFKQYIEYINKPLPKVLFYIIMMEVFGQCNGKDNSDLGYFLELDLK